MHPSQSVGLIIALYTSRNKPGFIGSYWHSCQLEWSIFLSNLLEQSVVITRVASEVEAVPWANHTESSPQDLQQHTGILIA